ncbi:MAG: hypothetical protein ACD_56C00036G0013 [uncultured bacterium]|nr:MAG: hypothetical protein ACD_56C00036G0013 [uncultured bacterium]
MASDFYKYFGMAGNKEIQVVYENYPKHHSCSDGIHSIMFFDGSSITTEEAAAVSDLIKEGNIELEYLEHLSPSGDCDGPMYETGHGSSECCPCCGRPFDD